MVCPAVPIPVLLFPTVCVTACAETGGIGKRLVRAVAYWTGFVME
jgi:hypothetical protein